MNNIYPHQEVTNILKKKNKELILNQNLLKSVEIGNLSDVKKFIEEGATLHKLSGMDLHFYNSEYDTLLHTAVKLNQLDIVKYLIDIGCNINAQTRRYKATTLHYATYLNVSLGIIELLLENNAKIEARDDDNASPFMWACYLNNTVAVKRLIEKKANVYLVDDFRLSSLDWASHQGNIETVELLTSCIDYNQEQLKNAYEQAIASGQTKIINFLNNLIHN